MNAQQISWLPEEVRNHIAQLERDLARLTAENERLENLTASGIHTCNADCQRPMCVLRRERDKAHADLARVTAERDDALYREQMLRSSERNLLEIEAFKDAQLVAAQNELSALRARVADLEAAASLHWLTEEELKQSRARVAELEKEAMILRGTVEAVTTQRQQAEQRVAELEATIAELTTDGNAATLAANLAKASKRNAELESNCRDLRVAYEQNASQCVQLNRELAMKPDTVEWLNGVTIQRQRAEQAEAHIAKLVAALEKIAKSDPLANGRYAAHNAAQALARAESATPAKHPDTERLDWLEAFYKVTEVGHWKWHELEDRMVADGFRSAIDAARKQEASK